MVFPNTRDLPRIGLAVMQAEAFITLELPARVRRWIPGAGDRTPVQESAHPYEQREQQVTAVGGSAA